MVPVMTEPILERVSRIDPTPAYGRILQVIGLVMEGSLSVSSVGEVCEVAYRKQTSWQDGRHLLAEVVGFKNNHVLLMPLGELDGIGPGSSIATTSEQASANVCQEMLGRVVDGMGQPLDGKGPIPMGETYPIYAAALNPFDRKRITTPLDLGIRAINGLLTCGRGQKMGIFSGSGVGKSVLLGMISRYTAADVNVIALIGERGREVKEFIEQDLKPEGLRRSVVVVATSDQPPLVRRRGALLAITIAEYFRNQGRHVLFLMDSLTRLAQAQREIGLAIGEPPTTKGYPPSSFTLLPKFLERAGTSTSEGTITGLYSVLMEGDDVNDPIPDAARALLDGHVTLSRDIAAHGLYPAIDLIHSTSRAMVDIVDPGHMQCVLKLTDMVATYRKSEDMINIGAYKSGTNKGIDQAISKWGSIQSYFRQGIEERVSLKESTEALQRLLL